MSDEQQKRDPWQHPVKPTYDGWEHATAYNDMMQCAMSGRIWVALPQVKMHGVMTTIVTHIEPQMWSLRDKRDRVRMFGFVGFVCGAHKVAQARIARAGGGGKASS